MSVPDDPVLTAIAYARALGDGDEVALGVLRPDTGRECAQLLDHVAGVLDQVIRVVARNHDLSREELYREFIDANVRKARP